MFANEDMPGYNPAFLKRLRAKQHQSVEGERQPRGKRDKAQIESVRRAREIAKQAKAALGHMLKQARVDAEALKETARTEAKRLIHEARVEADTIRFEAYTKAQDLLNEIAMVVAGRHRRPAKDIIEEVATKHGVRSADICGASRAADMVAIRHEAMARVYLARPDMSLPVIGKAFGSRDHTTVLHALKKLGVYKPDELAALPHQERKPG